MRTYKQTTADPLEYDDYKALVNGLREDGQLIWELYVKTSFCTGLRAHDVLNLKWEDILDTPSLTLAEHKTGKMRTIPFNHAVRSYFTKVYKELGSPSPSGYVFSPNNGATHYCIQTVNAKLKYWRTDYRLKVPNFSTHSFRKTFGRHVYETSGKTEESLLLLNTIFNHTDIRTTKRYIGITKDEINHVYESIKL